MSRPRITLNLQERLDVLGWSKRELARKLAQLRQIENPTFNQYYSLVDRALKRPESVEMGTIVELVEIMGGTLTLGWDVNVKRDE